jgi:hypothetical protein
MNMDMTFYKYYTDRIKLKIRQSHIYKIYGKVDV